MAGRSTMQLSRSATKPSQSTPAPAFVEAVRTPPPTGAGEQSPEQHPLWKSIALHLLPGAALTAFVIGVNAAFGVEPLLGLLIGILLVLSPLELGYLSFYARRTTGSW